MSSNPIFKLELGVEVRDKVTGYKGIIVCRSDHLYGCVRYAVQTKELKDHKPVDCAWFDEGALEVLDLGLSQDPDAPAKPTGGPRDDAPMGRATEGSDRR